MSKLTPEQAAEKQARRLKASTEDIRIGVEAVTEAPGKKAKAAVAKLRARWLESVDSGKWGDNVAAVPLADWQTAMKEKGLGRIAAGIDAAHDKVVSFYGQLFPFQDSLKADVDRLPDLTLEDSISRMTTWVRGMAKFRKK